MASVTYILTTRKYLNILITGGSHGIGRELLRHFLRAGHSILILDSNEDELARISRELPAWTCEGGGRAIILNCDLRSRDRIRKVVSSASTIFDGKLDILINNAMGMPHTLPNDRHMDDFSEAMMEEWDTEVAVSLTAPFLFSRLCAPLLKAGGTESSPSCVINISLMHAYQFNENQTAYSVAKAGLLGLTQSMAVSLGHVYKIRVNTILSGWIHVGTENESAEERLTKLEDGLRGNDTKWHPMDRVEHMDDLLRAVEYLAGAKSVTGQEIVLD
jgi:NAD(P)-dependent dehydrogenase (short-subunit alcohol dehydrogenase family)